MRSRRHPAEVTADRLRTIEVVLADGPGAQAREAHDRAHDRGGATPGPDDLETLRVTWYRDCPRCPNMN